MMDNQYDFSELKEMTAEELAEVVEQFHSVKIPVTAKEGHFFYYRRFPVDRLMEKQDRRRKRGGVGHSGINLNTKVKEDPTKLNLNKSKVKGYKNPYYEQPETEAESFERSTKKIMKNFPANRSLLVINYDCAYEKDYLKSVFQVNGKVRRVFSQQILKKNTVSRQKNVLYFNIVIFKDSLALLRCFDVKTFQWQVLNKFSKFFYKKSELEQEKIFNDYIKTLGDHLEIQDDPGMYYEVDGEEFVPVPANNYLKYVDKWDQFKKEKKKEVVREDYYDFGIENYNQAEPEQNQSEDDENSVFDEEQLENPDYLVKRKSILRKTFNPPKKQVKEE